MNITKSIGVFWMDMIYFFYNSTKKKSAIFFYYILFCVKSVLSRIFRIRTESFLGFKVSISNYNNFLLIYREIFLRGDYYTTLGANPIIYDLGANIGMASIYFKHLSHRANITCYEPDPVNFSCLLKNASRLKNIKCRNAAITGNNGVVMFETSKNGSVSSKVATGKKGMIEVKCRDLADVIKEKVDLCKMDIEGSEFDAVRSLDKACKMRLVKRWMIEYHHDPKNESRLSSFLEFFERNGFKTQIRATNIVLGKEDKRQNILIYAYQG